MATKISYVTVLIKYLFLKVEKILETNRGVQCFKLYKTYFYVSICFLLFSEQILIISKERIVLYNGQELCSL
jgi:hypothetical protein